MAESKVDRPTWSREVGGMKNKTHVGWGSGQDNGQESPMKGLQLGRSCAPHSSTTKHAHESQMQKRSKFQRQQWRCSEHATPEHSAALWRTAPGAGHKTWVSGLVPKCGTRTLKWEGTLSLKVVGTERDVNKSPGPLSYRLFPGLLLHELYDQRH